MKNNIILLGTLLISGLAFSQVGINTDIPKATLDVVGKPADISSLDGITAPRLTGDQLRAKTYTSAQTGTLVYVTTADTAPAGQTINVTAIGYFYFDGTKWVSTGGGQAIDTNIYNSDGSLTGPGGSRTLTLNGKSLNFVGTDRNTYWDTAGRIHQRATNTAADAVMGFHNGNANLYIQQWNSDSAITASDGSTELLLATHYTNNSAPIRLSTSPGNNTTGVERMRITGEGNVGIMTTDPTEKFDNAGITRLRTLPLNGATNAINTDSAGDMSAAQDQTFTATKTVVADANGVLGYVAGLPQASVNIYNANGTFVTNRTATIPSGQWLNFAGAGNVGIGGIDTLAKLNVNGFIQFGPNDSHYGVGRIINDATGEKYGLNQSGYFPGSGDANSPGTRIYTSGATTKGHISFGQYASATAYTEWGRFAQKTGNFGINTLSGTGSNNPTEKLDVNGNVRIRTLPINGGTNAHFTNTDGTISSTQNQTFTATKTVVADANGVLGYVSGMPTTTGSGSWFNTATGTLATANTQNIYQMGRVGVMTNSPTALSHTYNNSSSVNPFTVESDNAGSGAGNDTYLYGYGSSLTPGLFFLSARGTKASPVNMASGDLMGEYNFGGYANSGWNYSLTSVRGSYDGNGTTLDSSLHLLTSSTVRMRIDAIGNVGIGASAPKAKVHVQSGDVYVEQVGSGIIMKSPNGSCWRVTVSNTGTFASASITCP